MLSKVVKYPANNNGGKSNAEQKSLIPSPRKQYLRA